MSADKPDVDDAIGIVDPHHDAILVARDVEDSAAVVENVVPGLRCSAPSTSVRA